MPAPKKGPRFGGSASHQKAMMANLAASLFAAEGIVTTEAKAKALRPYAEKLITKAKKGGLHRYRDTLSHHARRGHVQQAVPRDRAPLRRAQRRLHPDPEARAPPGRQRPHGAHRTRLTLTLFEPEEAARQRPRAGRWSASGSPVAYDGAAFHGFAAQPGVDDRRRARSRRRSSGCCGHPVELTCAGRTDAGVHGWGQVVSFDADAERLRRRPAAGGRQRAVRPGDRRAGGRRWPTGRTSTPASTPRPAATATRCSTGRCPTRSSPPRPGTSPQPLDLGRMQAGLRPAHRRARLHVVLPAARRASPTRRSSAGCSTPAGRSTRRRARACSGSGSRPPRSATRWCAAITGTLVDVGLGKRTAADVMARPAGQGPRRPPARWPRPTASSSGRSSTDESEVGGYVTRCRRLLRR